MGIGKYELYFLRDKDKHEVDFLIVKNDHPWLMLEVKSSVKEPLSPALHYFQNQLQAPYAFQVVFDLPYIERNCFAHKINHH